MISVLSFSPDVLSRLCLMLSDTKLFRKRTLHSGPICYRPQTKFAQVMFSRVSVCPQGGLSLCPGGSLSRGVSVPRRSLSWGVSVRGVPVWGSLSWGVSVQGGLCPGGSLSRGVSVQGGLCPGGSLSREGVSVWGFSVQRGCLSREGLCPGVSVQGGFCPGGSLSRGGSLCGALCLRGVSVQGGLCPGGSLSRGVSVQGSLSRGSLSGGSLFRGVSACWVSVHGGLCHGDTLYGNGRAVRILLECILVFHSFIHSSLPLFIRNGFHGASPHLMGVTALSTWRYQVPTGFGIQQVGELE